MTSHNALWICSLLVVLLAGVVAAQTSTVAPTEIPVATTVQPPPLQSTTAAPPQPTTTADPTAAHTAQPTAQPIGTDAPQLPPSPPSEYTDTQKFGISCATFSCVAVAWSLFCFVYSKVADRFIGEQSAKTAVVYAPISSDSNPNKL